MQSIAIIGGCGHVGLPLGLALSSQGFNVKLIDINEKVIDMVNNGDIPFKEEGAKEILSEVLQKGLLAATQDMAVVQAVDIVVFVTGTPVDEHMNPKVNDVLKVIKMYLPYLNKEQLIVLRSTVFPGVFDVVEEILNQAFGSKCKLAFCPERIVQGKGIEEIFHLPQLVSANSKEAFKSASAVFEKVAPKLIPLTPGEAELAKLMTNSWRYLEFAIANQFYMMAEEKGFDFYKILAALSEDYPRAKHFAKAGFAAGPCLFKDTMQLSAFYNNKFFLGQTAMMVNEGLADFVVEKLEKQMGTLKNKKIALLGMTFKANNDDIRESLSFKVKKLLEFKMALPLIQDPYLNTDTIESVLRQAEGVILGVPHDEYKNLKIVQPHVDCWNFWKKKEGIKE